MQFYLLLLVIWKFIHFIFIHLFHPKNRSSMTRGRIFFQITKYSTLCVKEYFVDVSRIFLKKFHWVHLFTFTCSSFTLICSQNNILAWEASLLDAHIETSLDLLPWARFQRGINKSITFHFLQFIQH
jgi:hypothetical protein